MSTITGLISVGGGGGGATNIVTNPTHLYKEVATQYNIEFKYGTTLYDPTSNNFWTFMLANYNWGYYAECTTADTYVTVADITSATNGGFLHSFIGVGTIDGESTTMRFTVDGTATEITYSNGSGTTAAHYCPIMGGFYPNPQTTTDQAPFNTADLSVQQGAYLSADPSNGWYAGSISNGIAYPFISHNMDMSRLRFESSLKIEVKKSAINATANNNKAGAVITLS